MWLELMLQIIKYAKKYFKNWKIVKVNYWLVDGNPHALVWIRIHDEELRLRFRLYEGSIRVVDAEVFTRSQLERMSNNNERSEPLK
jgi:hypothetical protein